MPDWFLARAHFERDRPIDVRIRRGGQHSALTVAISEPAWRTWSSAQFMGGAAFYSVRLILLVLAICVGSSPPGTDTGSPCRPDVRSWSGRRRQSEFWLGSCASSPAIRAGDTHRLGNGLLPLGVARVAAIPCDLSPRLFFAAGSPGAGARALNHFRTPADRIGDRNDLRAWRSGEALAAGAFGGSGARSCRT
jgi:hypothetical protein